MTTRATNLYADLPAATTAEAFTELLARPGVRIERIVSRGQATPADEPMVQDHDEWVLLLAGAAGLRIGAGAEIALAPGDCVLIARGAPHWVTWTSADPATLWLAVHLDLVNSRSSRVAVERSRDGVSRDTVPRGQSLDTGSRQARTLLETNGGMNVAPP